MQLNGKVVVVTGAGYGLGRATSIGFCADGAMVVGIGRTESHLMETQRLCVPGQFHFVVGDVARADDVKKLFAEADRRHHRVDILVNNAALYPKRPFLEFSNEEWAYVIQSNVIGMAQCCREALPGMLARGFGRIVNLGSFAWKGPIPNSSAYSASKGAVGPLTKAIASEIDRSRFPDVLINELMPGVMKTSMSDSGEEPADAYIHVRRVCTLPANGPTGQSFVQSVLYLEYQGLGARLRNRLKRALGLK